jgi:hypothetical protein
MATAFKVEAAVPGRKRAGTSEHPLDLDLPVDRPVPLRAVVEAVVRAEVDAFRRRSEEQRFVHVLTERALADGLAAGVVRSGGSEAATDVDPDQAVATALLAYEDGLYKVIVDDEPVDSLDAPVQLHAGSRLLFLRLVALAGG